MQGLHERERERETLDHIRELICGPRVGLLSRAIGQVLLHPIGGGQLRGDAIY